jgi:hypothetical protein
MEENDSLEMPISGALIQATSATGTAAINPEHIINLHPYYYRQTLGTTVNVLTANKGLQTRPSVMQTPF